MFEENIMKKDILKKFDRKKQLLASPLALAVSACGGGGESENDEEVGSGEIRLSSQSVDVSELVSSYQMQNLYTADYDRDGDNDFIVTYGSFPPNERLSFEPFFLLNNGGVLEVKPIDGDTPAFTHPREGKFADLNNDGILDFVLVGHGWDTRPYPGEPNALFFGDEDGFVNKSFLLPDYLDFSHSVAVGDVNGDGFSDIYIGNIMGENRIDPYLLINIGGEKFEEISLGNEILSLSTRTFTASELVDLDNDGIAELIVGADRADGSRIFKFDDDQQKMELVQDLPESYFGFETTVLDIKAADINDDGMQDLVLLSTFQYAKTGLQILLQQADGSFKDQTDNLIPVFDENQTWMSFIEIADFDGDGDLDILTTQTSARGPNIYVNENGKYIATNAEHLSYRGWYDVSIDQTTGDQFSAYTKDGVLIVEQIII